jgi:hypothetical protein
MNVIYIATAAFALSPAGNVGPADGWAAAEFAASAPAARLQGGGQGQARGQQQRQDPPGQARGQQQPQRQAHPPGRAAAAEGRAGRIGRDEVRERLRALPPEVRRLDETRGRHGRMIARNAARGTARGLAPDAIAVRAESGGVRVLNRRGELLLELDERRANGLGAWILPRLPERAQPANAPAFCRSGEGHPVWGREWCIQRGFGLGTGSGVWWNRGHVEDVVYRRRPAAERLDRRTLIEVLGDVAVNRLALHALAQGYDRPLTGFWVAEPRSPQILRVFAGDRVVAEFVDLDADDRVDVLYVAHRHR